MGCTIGNPYILSNDKIPKLNNNTIDDHTQNIFYVKTNTLKCPHIAVKIFNTEVDALLDSGAGISVINSLNLVNKYGLRIEKASVRISTADGTQYRCLGLVNIPYTFKNKTRVVPTIVVPQITRELILGADFWNTFGIKPMIDMGHGPEQVATLDESIATIVCSHMEPTTNIPRLKSDATDGTLDIPSFDIPIDPVPENIETEHELSCEERENLIETIKLFELTAPGKLGRTSLIYHEIILKEGSKPRN